MNNQHKRLFERLPADIDAAVVISPVNRRYFTGFYSSNGLLFMTREKAIFLTDFRYIEAAAAQATGCECIRSNGLNEDLEELCKRYGIKKATFEADYLSVLLSQKYMKICPNVDFSGALDRAIVHLRKNKTPYEMERIKEAQRLTDDAYTHILHFIKEGVAEKDIALELEFFMRKNGADAASFDIIAVSGTNSSLPHGIPGYKQIEAGDFITMDFGAQVDGYRSDMTRTVAMRHVTPEMKHVYETVLEAQTAALRAIREGAGCCACDQAAREIIDAAGYGEYFGHGTGHSVGLEIHEEPRLSPYSDDVLEQGVVITVEPGIYLPGKFGVRIEDMVFVTDNGNNNLTCSDKSLIIL